MSFLGVLIAEGILRFHIALDDLCDGRDFIKLSEHFFAQTEVGAGREFVSLDVGGTRAVHHFYERLKAG